MSGGVRLQQVDAQPLAVVRRRASVHQLSTVVPAACGVVWAVLRAHRVERPGRHVALYLDGVINLEVGVEVTEAFVDVGEVLRSATPAGVVATVAHIGPYDQLHQAHKAIRDWCTQQGHEPAGPNWEIYGHWADPPAQPRTDVYYLLKAGA